MATLNLKPVPLSSFPKDDKKEKLLLSYVLEGIKTIRQEKTQSGWKTKKTVSKDGTSTNILRGPGKGKDTWHGRYSTHGDLKYESFRSGLLLNHSENEAKYIHEITKTEKKDTLINSVAEVWLNSYRMPITVTNRDFLELLITVDLPPHAEPFSEAHEAQIKEDWTTLFPTTVFPLAPPVSSDSPNDLRSFLVISIPIAGGAPAGVSDEVSQCGPPPPGGKVRGKYVSVEAVIETKPSSGNIDWYMATQSDPAGKIPSFVTNLSMGGQIAKDVPAFISWAKANNI